MCEGNISEINETFLKVKKEIPKDRHYIFDMYDKTDKTLCMECYTKTALMVQNLRKEYND